MRCFALLVALLFVVTLVADGPHGDSAPTHFHALLVGDAGPADGSLGVLFTWGDPCKWGQGSRSFVLTGKYKDGAWEEIATVDGSVHSLKEYFAVGRWTFKIVAVVNGQVGQAAKVNLRVHP